VGDDRGERRGEDLTCAASRTIAAYMTRHLHLLTVCLMDPPVRALRTNTVSKINVPQLHAAESRVQESIIGTSLRKNTFSGFGGDDTR